MNLVSHRIGPDQNKGPKLNGPLLRDFTMKYGINTGVGVIPCNLDEVQRSQPIECLTLLNRNGPWIRPKTTLTKEHSSHTFNHAFLRQAQDRWRARLQ